MTPRAITSIPLLSLRPSSADHDGARPIRSSRTRSATPSADHPLKTTPPPHLAARSCLKQSAATPISHHHHCLGCASQFPIAPRG
jgi:hypothetical protein